MIYKCPTDARAQNNTYFSLQMAWDAWYRQNYVYFLMSNVIPAYQGTGYVCTGYFGNCLGREILIEIANQKRGSSSAVSIESYNAYTYMK